LPVVVPQPGIETSITEHVMIALLRNGEERAVAVADDTRHAIIVAARLILDQEELRLGDQLCVMRV
jgi:hypothetical protein